MGKKLVSFLVVNLILGAGIIIHYNTRTSKSEGASEVKAEKVAVAASAPASVALQSPVPASVPAIQEKPVCVAIGPLDLEQKANMETALQKSTVAVLMKVEKKPVINIVWNLGKDKVVAQQLFDKQKAGAMQDAKFVLLQDEEKDWFVPITSVHTSVEQAKAITEQIAMKAEKINSGGRWMYKTKPDGYFFTFSDYKGLQKELKDSIDTLFEKQKQLCE